LISNFRFPVLDFWFPISVFQFYILDFQFPISNFQYQLLGERYKYQWKWQKKNKRLEILSNPGTCERELGECDRKFAYDLVAKQDEYSENFNYFFGNFDRLEDGNCPRTPGNSQHDCCGGWNAPYIWYNVDKRQCCPIGNTGTLKPIDAQCWISKKNLKISTIFWNTWKCHDFPIRIDQILLYYTNNEHTKINLYFPSWSFLSISNFRLDFDFQFNIFEFQFNIFEFQFNIFDFQFNIFDFQFSISSLIFSSRKFGLSI